jgi:hypothetical protein
MTLDPSKYDRNLSKVKTVVQILIFASARIVHSKVYASAILYPLGSVCKQKSIPISMNLILT